MYDQQGHRNAANLEPVAKGIYPLLVNGLVQETRLIAGSILADLWRFPHLFVNIYYMSMKAAFSKDVRDRCQAIG